MMKCFRLFSKKFILGVDNWGKMVYYISCRRELPVDTNIAG